MAEDIQMDQIGLVGSHKIGHEVIFYADPVHDKINSKG